MAIYTGGKTTTTFIQIISIDHLFDRWQVPVPGVHMDPVAQAMDYIAKSSVPCRFVSFPILLIHPGGRARSMAEYEEKVGGSGVRFTSMSYEPPR